MLLFHQECPFSSTETTGQQLNRPQGHRHSLLSAVLSFLSPSLQRILPIFRSSDKLLVMASQRAPGAPSQTPPPRALTLSGNGSHPSNIRLSFSHELDSSQSPLVLAPLLVTFLRANVEHLLCKSSHGNRTHSRATCVLQRREHAVSGLIPNFLLV